MAEEKKEEQNGEKEEQKSNSGNKLILIIIIVLLLLLLIIGGLVAYFLLADNTSQNETVQQSSDKKIEQKSSSVKKDTEALEIGPIYPLDPFTVNLKSTNNTRYLKCTINLEIDSPDTQPELDKIKPAVRDVVIRILSSKTTPEISTAKGKEKLKEELKKNINAILAKGEIKHVYFTAFVIQ